jgi:hypothetical protein
MGVREGTHKQRECRGGGGDENQMELVVAVMVWVAGRGVNERRRDRETGGCKEK